MLAAVLLLLVVLWFLGYIAVPGLVVPIFPLFYINGEPISLWNILIFALIVWAAGLLPSPLWQIAMVLIALWVLSILGVVAVPGLQALIVIAVILGLIWSLFTPKAV